MGEIRVLIADDHGVMRDGLRMLIDSQDDMTVVGEVDDAQRVVAAAVDGDCDVVVLDLSMPGGGGLSVISQLRARTAKTKVMVLTMHEQPAYLRQALAAGASGYIAKRAVGTQLLSGIRAVADGRSHIDASITEGGLADVITGPHEQGTRELRPLAQLSRRESDGGASVRCGGPHQCRDRQRTRPERQDRRGIPRSTHEETPRAWARRLGALRARLGSARGSVLSGPPLFLSARRPCGTASRRFGWPADRARTTSRWGDFSAS